MRSGSVHEKLKVRIFLLSRRYLEEITYSSETRLLSERATFDG